MPEKAVAGALDPARAAADAAASFLRRRSSRVCSSSKGDRSAYSGNKLGVSATRVRQQDDCIFAVGEGERERERVCLTKKQPYG